MSFAEADLEVGFLPLGGLVHTNLRSLKLPCDRVQPPLNVTANRLRAILAGLLDDQQVFGHRRIDFASRLLEQERQHRRKLVLLLVHGRGRRIEIAREAPLLRLDVRIGGRDVCRHLVLLALDHEVGRPQYPWRIWFSDLR